MTALALLPLALAASWVAIREWRPGALAAAAIFSAGVVSNNFYGATSLALWFPLLLWSLWITHQEIRMVWRAAAIAALAYGLTAFWLTPSYIQITTLNLKLVAEEGNLWSRWVVLAAGVLFVAGTDRWARGRRERAYPVMLAGIFLFFTLNVLGNHFLNFRVIGEPARLAPELDLVLILVVVEVVRRLWAGTTPRKAAALAIVLVSFSTSLKFVRRAWHIYIRDPNPQERVEYKITDWVARNLPGQRVMATGSVRFWYNAWHDLPQLGGGSEQGLINSHPNLAYLKVAIEEEGRRTVPWLQSFGVDAVITHDKNSKEIYHDFVRPEKFTGVLPVLYDDREGNVIYRAPRRYPGLARVVDRARLEALQPMPRDGDERILQAYADLLEKGPDSPAPSQWEGTDVLRIQARVEAGQAVVALAAYDPGWRAYSGGAKLAVRKDAMGQILIDAPPGEHDLKLVFELPLENAVGRAISILTVLAMIALIVRRPEVKV